ncbi:MAG: hypothetical protein C4294_09605, partial [Nitrospiraceae bacterium]
SSDLATISNRPADDIVEITEDSRQQSTLIGLQQSQCVARRTVEIEIDGGKADGSERGREKFRKGVADQPERKVRAVQAPFEPIPIRGIRSFPV